MTILIIDFQFHGAYNINAIIFLKSLIFQSLDFEF